MNESDKRKVKEKIDGNPEFKELYSNLEDLRRRTYNKVATLPLFADELNAGKDPIIFATVNLDEADALVQEAVTLAVVLARFFPRSQQIRWQAIFTTLALGGRGVVEKQEKGGRRKGIRPESARNKYVKLLKELTSFRKYSPYGTYDDFLELHPEYKRGTINRALRWERDGKP
jgi:hypothetical protein